MKTWMKILAWFGLGSATGFLIGQRFEAIQSRKEIEEAKRDAYAEGLRDGNPRNRINPKLPKETAEDWANDISERLKKYRGEDMMLHSESAKQVFAGGDTDGDEGNIMDISSVAGINAILKTPATDDEDPEMPMEEPIVPPPPMVDADIPQPHMTHFDPEIVSEEEYFNNGDLDEERLIFYELDEVLYNTTTQSVINEEDYPNCIGYGTLGEFRANPTQPVKDTVFVVNRTAGTRFRIDRMEEAFADAVDGNCPPEEDDDFWEDV